VITGSEDQLVEKYQGRREVGSDRGPAYPRRPDRIFKRSVRGMVPHKRPRGREAIENVRVYVGNPYEDEVEAEVLEGTSLDRLSNIKFVPLGDISEALGANVTW
jgi:large subunit ribosomal protein L13